MADAPSNGSEPADNRSAFERFESLTKKLVAVPKAEIDAARKKDKAARSPASRPTR
jgi:hypothetical protein